MSYAIVHDARGGIVTSSVDNTLTGSTLLYIPPSLTPYISRASLSTVLTSEFLNTVLTVDGWVEWLSSQQMLGDTSYIQQLIPPAINQLVINTWQVGDKFALYSDKVAFTVSKDTPVPNKAINIVRVTDSLYALYTDMKSYESPAHLHATVAKELIRSYGLNLLTTIQHGYMLDQYMSTF